MAATLNAKLTLSISNFQKSLNKAERSLRRTGKRMAEVGNQLAVSVSAPLLGVGGAALKAFADIEKFENGLASMMGSAEAAEKELEKLKEVAKAPGLDLTQAVKGSVRLQSVGIAAEQARKVLSETGNAIALVGGSSDDLDGVTLALQQIGSKGKVFAEEINQINERLPQIRAAMKAAFGTANTEDIQAMGISAEQFIQGITVELGKLPRAVGGMSNSFNNARQAVVQSLSTIGESLEKNFNISARIDAFSERLQRLADSFANLSPKAQKAILIVGGLAAAIGPVLIAISSFKFILASAASGLSSLTGAITVLMTPIGGIVAAIAALSAAFVYLYKTNERFRDIANQVFKVIQNALSTAFKVLQQSIQVIIKYFKTLFSVMASVGRMFVAVGSAVLNFVRKIPIIGKVIDGVVNGFKFLSKVVPAVISGLIAEVESLLTNLTKRFDLVAVNAKLLALRVEKGLTLKGDAKKALQKQIDSLKSQKSEIAKTGKSFGQAFKEAFKKSLEGGDNLGALMTNNVQSTPIPTAAADTGGFTMPTQTTAITEQTKAVEQQKNAFIGLANAQALQSKAMASNIEPMAQLSTGLQRIKEQAIGYQTELQRIAELHTQFNTQLTNIVNDGLANMATGLGSMVGEMAAGAMSLADVGRGLVAQLAGILGQIGELAIKTGIATLGIKVALQSLNPAAAIAGGIALVALSKFVQSKMANAVPMAKGGIVLPTPGGTIAQIGEAGKAEAVIPLDRLGQMMGNSGGGISKGEFTIKGRDLVYILNLENQAQNRSF